MYVYTTYTRPPPVQAQYSRKWPIISSSCYKSSTGWLQSQSHIATDGQSVCLSWCRAPNQILVTVWQLLSYPWEGAHSDERTCLSFVSQSAVLGQLSVCTIFIFYMCHMLLNTYAIYTRPLSVRAQYSRLCPISNGWLVWVWVTLRLTVTQSVCLGIEPRPGYMTRY
jgi:hypothetical protein